jgi:membrane dipeptidase
MLRRDVLRLLAAAGAAALGGQRHALSDDNVAGTRVAPAAGPPMIDMHSHAWRRRDFASDLREGGINLAVFVVTSDRPLLTRDGGRERAVGNAPPGYLHSQAKQQADDIVQAARRSGFNVVGAPTDLAAGAPAIMLGYEGGDVLEGDLQRVGEIHAEGARLLQLAHYRVNELTDIQTEDPAHGGLTPLGIDVVRECNRLGIIVDLAHATLAATEQTLRASSRPLLLSHTFLTAKPRRFTRGITADHARAVAAGGGVIGVVPFPSAFRTLDDYTDGIARMADVAGIDHVGVGSDMSGIRGSPPLNRYKQYPALAEKLVERGLRGDELAKVLGGNFLRVFAAVTTGA